MRKPSLLIIFLTVFIDLIGFGIVLPLLPKYAERYGAEGLTIGLIVGSYSLMQFFFAPLWGRLSDRIGRRPVILLSTFGSIIAYGLFGYSAYHTGDTGLWILVGSRLFAGVCGANLSVASAYIADITSVENRSKGMGMIGMAFGLGFILGPAIGGLSYKYFGLAGPGFVASIICACNFVLACILLQESRHADGSNPVQRPRWEQWKQAFARPQLRLLMLLFFLANFCFISFEVTLPLILGSPSIKSDELTNPEEIRSTLNSANTPLTIAIKDTIADQPTTTALLDQLNWAVQKADFHQSPATQLDHTQPEIMELVIEAEKNKNSPRYNRLVLEEAFPDQIKSQTHYFNESKISYLFAYCGFIAAMVQGGLIGRLVKRYGEPKLVWASLVIVAGAMLMIPLSAGLGILLLGLGLFSGGSGINRAPTMGMISKNANSSEQGAILGVAQSVGTLARILGPVFATVAYAYRPILPYVICAAVALIAAMIARAKLKTADSL